MFGKKPKKPTNLVERRQGLVEALNRLLREFDDVPVHDRIAIIESRAQDLRMRRALLAPIL